MIGLDLRVRNVDLIAAIKKDVAEAGGCEPRSANVIAAATRFSG